ncbi:hypothetical protein Poly24_40840 [Rosistilla carotiformis]|uniref:Cytochrome oxidase subunit IV n=1 Tax=Rosistilla carotiformis TaxID=2528017 RepID=A0A518JXV2_9BACT|nr:cytochrome C oxidase subunit IV family protein [Rosistilla carotiformis]QDV70363.1 hypothetical protein Poly24_40840 [Rosistilla carotiformis]
MSSHNEHADGEFAHPMPVWMLLAVFFALTALTILTVFQASLHLGNWEIWIAMTIASVKATLVMAFFMHMLWDKPFNIIMFLSSFLFVTLFVSFLLMDTHAYNHNIILKPVAESVQ